MTLLLLFAALFQAAPATDTPDWGDELALLAEPLLERHDVPGLCALWIEAGEVRGFRALGWADRERELPFDPDTVVRVGSISKCVAAWVVARLAEEERLDLDRPVDELLESWQVPRSRYDETGVTPRRLLCHTAGLSVHGLPGFRGDRPLPELVEVLRGRGTGAGAVRLVAEPGSGWRYSGGGYLVLQLLVEELTGRAFAQHAREEVLGPLGMSSSSFGFTDELLARAATPYDRRGRELDHVAHVGLAAAGFVSTPRDLARFALASLPDHRDDAAREVLSTPMLEELLRPSEEAPNWGTGFMQFELAGVRLQGHTGGTHGWITSLLLHPPTGSALILVANGTDADRFMERIEAAWVRRLPRERSAARAPDGAAASDDR